ncbi:MAG: hypothetical protein ABI273_05005 [Lacunisphaera sp.]
MGLTIHLQDAKGKVLDTVTDESNLLHKILPATDDAGFHTISRIDWYGDTTFNRMQMEDVIREFGRLDVSGYSSDEKDMLGEIVNLANRGIEKPHFYLKFCGD